MADGSGGGGSGGGGGRGDGFVADFRQPLLDLGQGLLFAFAEAFKFFGYALLDLEFEGFGAGGIGLFGLVRWGNVQIVGGR